MFVTGVTDLQEEQEVVSVSEQLVTQKMTENVNKEEKENNSGVKLEISDEMRSIYQQQAKNTYDMAKMMEIARHISNREKVQPTEEKKLMEYNTDLYQAAKATSILYTKEDQFAHNSLSEEEQNQMKVMKLSDLKREMSNGWRVDIGSSDSSVTVAGVDLKKL